MSSIMINPKFSVGDKVYAIWYRSVGVTCPVCNGEKYLSNVDNKEKCLHCYGRGKLFTQEKLWQLLKEIMTVDSIKITINKDDEISIAYTLNNMKGHKRRRPECYCFASENEAQAYCDELNTDVKDTIDNEIKLIQTENKAAK